MTYLHKRGIGREMIELYQMGYASPAWDGLSRSLGKKGFTEQELLRSGLAVARSSGGHIDRFRSRVLFPISDTQGRVVGFGGRILGDGEPKYLNSPETPLYHKSRSLYGLNQAKESIRKEGFGILVEGYFDCLTLSQSGIANVAATSGTALTEGHLRLMRRYSDRWTVVFDGDAAGIRAAKRSLELFVDQGLIARCVLLPDGEDPDTFVRSRGAEQFRRLLANADTLMGVFVEQTAAEHPPATVEGKVTAVREVVAVLAKVKSVVEQDEYIRMAADRLGVKEEVLRYEIHAAASERKQAVPAESRTVRQEGTRRAEEVGVVKAMLAHDKVASAMRDRISLEQLEDEDCRTVAGRIFSLLDEEGGGAVGRRIHFEEERLNRLTASWMIELEGLSDEKTALQEAEECLARIHRRRVDRESRLLQEKIAQAEREGNKEVLYRLLRIKQGLRLQSE